MEEPTLACPSCSREFQIPQKCIRPDDLEFLPVPRVLSCLHTVCQSCLQEMHEKNEGIKETLQCPICRQESFAKDVTHLPLDVSILKGLLNNSQADVLSFCSRCYDEVPSYSWCQTCSTALCEFHHQDHKLSVDTSKHQLQTFKDISHKHVHIEPRLPPIPCPEIEKQDCTIYCHDCKCVISIHAALQNHSEHKTEDCLHGYNVMRERVHVALESSKGTSKELKVALRSVTNRMRELDSECQRATGEIEAEFDALRKLINERESALISRLGVLSERKRSMLAAQLGKFSEYIEDCYLTSDIAESLLRVTDDMRSSSQDAAYLLGMTDAVETKLSGVLEKLKCVNLNPDTDADIAVSFNLAELAAVQLNVPILGCIQTREDPDDLGKDDLAEPDFGPLHSKHRGMHKQRIVQTHAPSITFTIKAEPAPAEAASGPLAANALATGSRSANTALVIEARSTESVVEEGKARNVRNHGLGVLLGQVILMTEMDKKLAVRHDVRTFFESVVIKNVPIMKITKEFLPAAANPNPFRSPDKEQRDGAHERGRVDGHNRSVERGDRSAATAQGTTKGGKNGKDHHDHKGNAYLAHANDKVNVHGQRAHHQRESNYQPELGR